MKVIFLDVDGVLNNSVLLYHYGMDYIDENMVSLFAEIVNRTRSRVVLSSSWRLQEKSKNMVGRELSLHGVEIFGITKEKKWNRRHKEISSWLGEHPEVSNYAILDDDPSAGIGMEDCFFNVDGELGLDRKTADRVIQHLNSIS